MTHLVEVVKFICFVTGLAAIGVCVTLVLVLVVAETATRLTL